MDDGVGAGVREGREDELLGAEGCESGGEGGGVGGFRARGGGEDYVWRWGAKGDVVVEGGVGAGEGGEDAGRGAEEADY